MGRIAFMVVENKSAEVMSLFITNQRCMYDGNHDGSNPSYFNGLSLQPGERVPATGQGQKIEVKASSTGGDTCITETSSFDLEIEEASVKIGTAHISERWNHFKGKTTNPDIVKVDVGNAGGNDTIEIQIFMPS